DALDKKYIHQQYFSKKKVSSLAEFNKVAWKLHTVVEQFISHYELEKNQQQKSHNLLQYYSENYFSKSFTALHTGIVKQLEATPEQGEAYYLHLFRLQNDLYFHPETIKKEAPAASLLSDAQLNLDRFYILSKLRIAIELFSRQQNLQEKHTIRLLDEIIMLAKGEKSPAFNIYLSLISLIMDGHQHKVFEQLKNSFSQNLTLYSKTEQAIILQFLLNYTNRLFNNGQAKYLVPQFELYQLAVQKKLLIENNNQMTDVSFINIIITACLSKDFNYAQYFLQAQKKYLNPVTGQNALNLSWAYIYFHSGQFEKAWIQLLKTNFITTDYKLRARSLLLRCYYEQLTYDDELKDTLKHSLQSFKKFIYRLSTFSERVKTLYYNQILVIRALFHFDPEVDQKKDFKNKWTAFLDTHPAISKKWLLQKINML
ncbi:MAG: hypothetical protein ACI8VT_002363, partial [Saprospiraceae bacterium]